MASDDQTNITIEFYGQNRSLNMYHMTRMWLLKIVTFRDLTLTLTRTEVWRLHSYSTFANIWECSGLVWACLSRVGGSENQNAKMLNFDLTLKWHVTFWDNFKSALEPSRWDLSNAASPVTLRSLVWELAVGGGGGQWRLAETPVKRGLRSRPGKSKTSIFSFLLKKGTLNGRTGKVSQATCK